MVLTLTVRVKEPLNICYTVSTKLVFYGFFFFFYSFIFYIYICLVGLLLLEYSFNPSAKISNDESWSGPGRLSTHCDR